MEMSYDTIRRVLTPYMDDGTIIDWADEYGEPGYDLPRGATTPMVLVGDWWCRCGRVLEDDPHNPGETRAALHDVCSHHPRVWNQLEEQGVELVWHDEWIVTYDGSSRAYRTTADSYSWQSSILWTDGDFLTPEDGIDAWLEEVANDPRRALPSHVWSADQLAAAGFVQWEPDDPHTYESGWHPGQTDDPEEITRAIRGQLGDDVEIVFYLDGVGQFDVRFSAYTRTTDDD